MNLKNPAERVYPLSCRLFYFRSQLTPACYTGPKNLYNFPTLCDRKDKTPSEIGLI